MGGFGVMDFMVKSYRNNRGLLKSGKKSLRKIYQENNLHYIKKKVRTKTANFDEEQKRIFLEKFHARRKRAKRKSAVLFIILLIVFSLFLVVLVQNI